MVFSNNCITFHHHIMGINASLGTCITSHVGFFSISCMSCMVLFNRIDIQVSKCLLGTNLRCNCCF